jgi:ABC-type branched-subunit amino acid transport system permease subunit
LQALLAVVCGGRSTFAAPIVALFLLVVLPAK